jgi:hypothetical protein
VLSDPGRLAARNYEEGWNRIDGKKQEWRPTAGAGWNGVVDDLENFRRKLTEVDGAFGE